MIQTVTSTEARARFGEFVDLVYYQGAVIIVSKMGKPLVKIVKADPDETSSRDISDFIGAWNDEDGDIIEKEAKKFRKNFKLF